MVLVLSDIPRPCPKASLLLLATIQLLVQACVLRWLGSSKSIVSVVLIVNDTSFVIMIAIFTTIGSIADYGTCAGSMRASLRTQRCRLVLNHWKLVMGLYIVDFISYGAPLGFYTAAFPHLARNTSFSQST